MTRSLRCALAVAAALPLLAFAPPAHAGNEAAAEALFLEAKRLVAQGKLAEACPKFAESNRLDRGAGTMIHLGDCYEKNKQTASAWAVFREAASAAQALGRADWEKLATTRAAALETKLARITVKVSEPADKIEVKRDDSIVSQASWGVPLPVDVGPHTIEASAPGRKAFKTTVVVASDGDKRDVVVPKLEAEPKAPVVVAKSPATTPEPTPAKPGDDDTKSGSGMRTVGFVLAGVGVLGVGAGAVTGLMAIGKNNDSQKVCPTDGACGSQAAVDANQSARTLGTISTVAFAVGGVALAGGAVLIFTNPASKTGKIRVFPAAGPSTAGMSLGGAF